MSRTIELGRAVLCSPNSQLQLWLTTLITLSPQHDSTNLHQLSKRVLLDYLIARNAWVCRGNGLHIMIELTVQGEPLGGNEMRELARMILNAQIWSQLNLRPSLPLNNFNEDALLPDSGKLQINISHSRIEPEMSDKKPHRLCLNVPFEDAKPPPNVSVLTLQSLQFSMEIVEMKAPRNSKKRKCSQRSSPSRNSSSPARKRLFDKQEVRAPEGSTIPFEPEGEILTTLNQQNDGETSARSSYLCIKRRKESVSDRTSILNYSRPIDLREVGKLVDAAMRLSISEASPRSTTGLKIVTNSFAGTLAEISPSLWSPGYLLAVSQRAHFVPIVSHSLNRATMLKSRSTSLQAKVETLRRTSSTTKVYHSSTRVDNTQDEDDTVTNLLKARLWIHMQKKLFETGTTAPLKSFCASDNILPAVPSSDDLLDESPVWKEMVEHEVPKFHYVYGGTDELDEEGYEIGFHPSSSDRNHPMASESVLWDTESKPAIESADDMLLGSTATRGTTKITPF
ncbi:uncharacterized protein BDR25DRAFT_73301 [Lindgomyces ingoldianus]|uniref:Uncharacterized protein n=1 Tax=Lindgomyces ingoldianus TaxID=673940 RepID=A0ACB6QLT6_9PLEO|nr:uncharacterized protein BDR25DRAFT_73301 [Lindgomyces ingoldianus]KAF2467106.1 hypothetical protein BDR25DRAFT_73301 [Lindgomyces ingoldianus]